MPRTKRELGVLVCWQRLGCLNCGRVWLLRVDCVRCDALRLLAGGSTFSNNEKRWHVFSQLPHLREHDIDVSSSLEMHWLLKIKTANKFQIKSILIQ